MTQQFTLMIAGDSVPTGTIDVVAPFDRSLIATVETCGADGVEQALDTAYQLFRDRSNWLVIEHRIAILERAAEVMGEQAEELAIEAAREGGKVESVE